MKSVKITNTKLKVSKLCYGTGPGKKIKNLYNLLLKSYDLGVNFWDTADCYGTEKIVGEAAKKVGRENVVIQTKIDAWTATDARKQIKAALRNLNTEYIDIMLLHHVHTPEEWKRRQGAFKELQKWKDKGIIKYIGFSTHSSPTVVENAPKEVDIILASIDENHLDHGTKEQMLKALKKQRNKGIIAMKVLGAGQHVNEYKKRMRFAKGLSYADCLVIGMLNEKELKQNVRTLS